MPRCSTSRWLDDDLFKDHARTIALFNGMVRRGLEISWDASNGVIASSCTDEIVAAAAESGCVALIVGMESGNPRILREIRKPGTVDVFLRASEVFQRYEQINSSAYLIIGFPGETLSMIQDTVDASLQMNLDWYRIKTLQPLPNTPIYDTMLADGLLPDADKREVRYITGGYGRSHAIDLSGAGEDALRNPMDGGLPEDHIPDAAQLDEVWFHMNYALNYQRVCRETRPVKLEQQRLFLDTICDVIAPGNALALYTKGMVQAKLGRGSTAELVSQLSERLDGSAYWQQRFDALGLRVADLERAA